ncbi:MAG: Gfo/Idh/MocA family oxidoreductase [Paludibaculum sp.]
MVALADVVKTNLESTQAKFKVENSRSYYGPDSGKQLAESKLDAIVIETPTYFHAEQAKWGVDAGKHVYMAKPMAVDVPGCKSVLASGDAARQKNLTFYVDFQTRVREVYKEAATRIFRGDIGKPAFAQVYTTPAVLRRTKGHRTWIRASGASPISTWTRCWAVTSSWSRTFTSSTSPTGSCKATL